MLTKSSKGNCEGESMKVLEMMNKLEDLERLRDDLRARMNDDELTGNDSNLMYQAAETIDDYIHELQCKEVKV
jgi:hypothetical protein